MYDDGDLDEPRYFTYPHQANENRVMCALRAIVPAATDEQLVEVVDALTELIGEKTNDLDDKINRRGQWDPDY